jgi:diadenosine tetraphosphatase ApaH/serine/threonine PP2A family protein phosphatase
MPVAALYDVHGNLPALRAVLADPRLTACERIVVGGDVGPGPMTAACLDLLRGLGDRAVWIHGNCERELVDAFDRPDGGGDGLWERRTAAAAAQLSEHQRDFLAGLPGTVTASVRGLGEVLFCHGTPRSDEEIVTAATPVARLAGVLAGVTAGAVVCGHTHVQFDRADGPIRVINAGSVGMPYEGAPGAYWARLGPEVELLRTEYDAAAAAAAIRRSGYPGAEAAIEDLFTSPPSREDATAEFERQAAARRG